MNTTVTQKRYMSKNNDFVLIVQSDKKGGIIREVIKGQIQKPGIGLTANEMKMCIDKYELSNPVVCAKWNSELQ